MGIGARLGTKKNLNDIVHISDTSHAISSSNLQLSLFLMNTNLKFRTIRDTPKSGWVQVGKPLLTFAAPRELVVSHRSQDAGVALVLPYNHSLYYNQ